VNININKEAEEEMMDFKSVFIYIIYKTRAVYFYDN